MDTEMERKDMGLTGSYKVTVKLMESMLTALVHKALEHTLYILHVSVALIYYKILQLQIK